MNIGQYPTVRALTACAVAAAIATISSYSSASTSAPALVDPKTNSTSESRPSLVFLYNNSSEADWIATVGNLKSHFNIHFIDTSEIEDLPVLHLKISTQVLGSYKISSAASANALAAQYAEQYSHETQIFHLPSNTEDLFELTTLFHHLMDTRMSSFSRADNNSSHAREHRAPTS